MRRRSWTAVAALAMASSLFVAPPGALAAVHPTPPTLYAGDRGSEVAVLFRSLHDLGYVPASMKAPRRYTPALVFAVRRFQAIERLPTDGIVASETWNALAQALRQGDRLPAGALGWRVVVSLTLPETVRVYHNGRLVAKTPCNTGVPGALTPPGLYFVYETLPYQVMRGVNPNGTHYADPVHDIWYFDGGDALHGFVRATYGHPQSNGCVEIPPDVARSLWGRMPLGAEVDVVP